MEDLEISSWLPDNDLKRGRSVHMELSQCLRNRIAPSHGDGHTLVIHLEAFWETDIEQCEYWAKMPLVLAIPHHETSVPLEHRRNSVIRATNGRLSSSLALVSANLVPPFVPACTTAVTTSHARLSDRMTASRHPTADSLTGPIVSSKRETLVAVAGRAEGADKDAMEKEKKLGRQPLFGKNRQHLRLRAEPQPLERGCAWELLLLCTERIVSATSGSADLHRWLDAHDVPPQDRVAQGACSGSL